MMAGKSNKKGSPTPTPRARYWEAGDPLSLVAVCPRAQAEVLVRFDHHQVVVDQVWGILITYPWMPLETAPEPLMATVLFNPAPKHAASEAQVRAIIRGHPRAPLEVQAIVDTLVFHPPAS
jgi:hypothetical protein